MGNFGPMEMLVIAIFGLLVFGPKKLPEMARHAAQAVREFKKVTGEITHDLQSELDLNSYEPKSKTSKSSESKTTRTAKPADETGQSSQNPDQPKPGPR